MSSQFGWNRMPLLFHRCPQGRFQLKWRGFNGIVKGLSFDKNYLAIEIFAFAHPSTGSVSQLPPNLCHFPLSILLDLLWHSHLVRTVCWSSRWPRRLELSKSLLWHRTPSGVGFMLIHLRDVAGRLKRNFVEQNSSPFFSHQLGVGEWNRRTPHLR